MSEEIQEIQKMEEPKTATVTQKLEPGAESGPPRPRQAETRKLEPDAEIENDVVPQSEAPAPKALVQATPRLGLSQEEMNWAALAHASILVTLLLGLGTGGLAVILGPIIPAVIWYAFREKSEYVVEQARQATVFQVAGILGMLVLSLLGALLVAAGWVVSAVLVVVLIGLILLPLMLVLTLLWVVALVCLPIAQVVYGCYAAIEAYNGRPFRYWLIADQVDRYESQA